MFTVGREIHFSYGHRLINYQGKCARLHGHTGRVVIEIASPQLDAKGMVTDFFEIKTKIGAWIDGHLDHRMILSDKDPLVETLRQKGEEIVVMPENPTAEALARWIYKEARKLNLPVSRVTLWETENSFAVYQEP
ncbi:MAG TPA: 6-carboxytetrahydropterin synthase [Verrucomicrobiae bacterium]|nr:6-carboxytetrahydropterin synthase [Verrucomicrobiae bacterium]